jgi:hypothetical protein
MKEDIPGHLRERNSWYAEATNLNQVLAEVNNVVYQMWTQKTLLRMVFKYPPKRPAALDTYSQPSRRYHIFLPSHRAPSFKVQVFPGNARHARECHALVL